MVWIGTFVLELFQYNPATDRLTGFTLPITNLAGEGIWAIHEDNEGSLWLGSDRGLTRFDPQTGTTRHVTQHDGLPGSIVYAILQDDFLGRLWLSTNHGLARYDERLPPEHKVRTYDAADGLHNTEFNRRAALKSHDGTFYFGGLNGLTWFHPTEIHNNRVAPPVALTRIERSNRDTTVTVIPYGLDHLILSYRDYTLTFEFTALNFTDPASNQYAYQLAGFDKDWIEAGTHRFARYTNIPPGEYVFRVKGSNNDGVWNEDGVALPLTITPPFWQTWWFRTTAGGLLLAGLITLIRFVSTRKLRRQLHAMELQQKIQHERERISRDLHDNVGVQLSNIIAGIELVYLSDRADDRQNRQAYLQALDEDARLTLEQLRETIWALKQDAVPLDTLGEQIERYLNRRLYYVEQPIAHCAVTGEAILTPEQALNLFRMVQEAVNNTLKHAGARHLSVTLRVPETNLLELLVHDDGTFHPPADDRLHGFGLDGMAHRARELGGTFALHHGKGDGTTVRIAVPLREGAVSGIPANGD